MLFLKLQNYVFKQKNLTSEAKENFFLLLSISSSNKLFLTELIISLSRIALRNDYDPVSQLLIFFFCGDRNYIWMNEWMNEWMKERKLYLSSEKSKFAYVPK